jgi:hypothetical protein
MIFNMAKEEWQAVLAVASAPGGGQCLIMGDYVTGPGGHDGGERCRSGLMLTTLPLLFGLFA